MPPPDADRPGAPTPRAGQEDHQGDGEHHDPTARRHRPRGNADLKRLAKEVGLNKSDLLVLAPTNDPFTVGQPFQLRDGEWFSELWHQHDFGIGCHLRRCHYAILGHGVTCPDGTPYENTERCWTLLNNAAKCARSLGLVDPHAFVDRRNTPPVLNFLPRQTPTPGVVVDPWELDRWTVPSIDVGVGWSPLTMPSPEVVGYDYEAGDQPVLVEVWVEKSTMHDVLDPLCRSLGVNLAESAGFQSITATVNLLQRAAAANRPARVLYISDFDPAGDAMPRAVARQVEFWCDEYAPGIDIALEPVVLTRRQVVDFALPRIPIKDTDRRRNNFEDRHGEGAVELDALEALHPGELAQIVRHAINQYRDPDLPRALRAADFEAQAEADFAWRRFTEPEREHLGRINTRITDVVAGYRTELQVLAERMAADLGPLQDEIDVLVATVTDRCEEFDFVPADRPEPEIDFPNEDEFLFSSTRDYLDQLAAYRRHRCTSSPCTIRQEVQP